MKLEFIQNTSPRKAATPGYRWTEKGNCSDEILKQIDDYRREFLWNDSCQYNGGIILLPKNGIGVVFRRFLSSQPDRMNRSKYMVNGLVFQLHEASTMGINGIWDLPCLSDDAEESLIREYDFTPSLADYPPEFAEFKVALTAEANCVFQLEKNVGKFSLTRIAIPGEVADKSCKKKSPDKVTRFPCREQIIEFDEEKKGSSVMVRVLVCILIVTTGFFAYRSYHFEDQLKSKESELVTKTKKLDEANDKISTLENEIAILKAPGEINETLGWMEEKIAKILTLSDELKDLSKKLPELQDNLEQFKKRTKSISFKDKWRVFNGGDK